MSLGLILAWGIAVLIEIGVPVAASIWFARRYGVKVTPFLLGAGIFFVFQLMLRIPLVQLLSAQLAPHLQGRIGLQVVYLAGLALTAALFESGGRWLGYRYLFGKLKKSWRNGVAYGLGHGGIESAFLVGLSSASNLIVGVVVAYMGVEQLASLSPELATQLGSVPQILTDAGVIAPLLGALERMLTMPFHIAMSLLVLLSFTRGQKKWFWFAVAAHALVDFTAPGMSAFDLLPDLGVELYIAVWTALSFVLIFRLRGEGETGTEQGPDTGPLTLEV